MKIGLGITLKKESSVSINTLVVISVVSMIMCYSALILSDNTIHYLTSEDGLFENTGAFFFLLTSMIFMAGFLKSNPPHKFLLRSVNRDYSLLMAGILFFFIFGEEISWGQRIIGIDSGEFFRERNIQGETNLHNLKVFNSVDKNNVKKEWWYLFTMSRMFRLFWFTWCIIIPVSVRSSKSIKDFIQEIGIPILSPVFGLLLILNYSILKFFEDRRSRSTEVVEIEECVAALLFFIVAIYLVFGPESQSKHKISNEKTASVD